MKSTFVFSALTAAVVLFSSCKKDKTPEPEIIKNAQVTAKIDGVQFQSFEAIASQDRDTHLFVLAATDDKGNHVAISANDFLGTHNSASDDDVEGIYTTSTGAAYASALDGGSATVTITKFDLGSKKMSGTFSYTAPSAGGSDANGIKTVTEGKFTDVTIVIN